jgi:hypothetical protein
MAKKELNNPKKPAVKTRSTVNKLGGKVVVQSSKKSGTVFTADGKPGLDKKGDQTTSVYSLRNSLPGGYLGMGNKKLNMTETKKAIRTGGAPTAGLDKATVKGAKVVTPGGKKQRGKAKS